MARNVSASDAIEQVFMDSESEEEPDGRWDAEDAVLNESSAGAGVESQEILAASDLELLAVVAGEASNQANAPADAEAQANAIDADTNDTSEGKLNFKEEVFL